MPTCRRSSINNSVINSFLILLNDRNVALYTRIVLDLQHGGLLIAEENGDEQYIELLRQGGLPFFDNLIEPLDSKSRSGGRYFPQALRFYVRPYQRGSVLRKHLDRPDLEHTLSITLGKNVPADWPLLAEDQHRHTISLTVPVGSGAMFSGGGSRIGGASGMCQRPVRCPIVFALEMNMPWGGFTDPVSS